MSNNLNEHQVVLFLVGEQGVGKSWIAEKFVKEFGFTRKISIEKILKQLASDASIFNIPAPAWEAENIDKPFLNPVLVREMHVRRLLGKVGLLLPITVGFNANRIAISNFICPRLETPRDVLEYIHYDVINKINPEFVPLLSYQDTIGKPGIFVVDDLKSQSELDYAKNNYQMSYVAYVDSKKKKKKEDVKVSRSEIDWDAINTDYTIMNDTDAKKVETVLLDFVSKFNGDVLEKIKKGNIPPLPKTINQQVQSWADSKGPFAQSAQAQRNMTSGKASFVKESQAEFTSKDRVRDYHVRGQY